MSNEELANPWKRHEAAVEMRTDDRKNAFDRAEDLKQEKSRIPHPESTFEADRRNRFEIHDAVRAERRKFADSQEVSGREAEREQQRREWTRQSDAPRAAGGTLLDENLAAIKRASDADRLAGRNPAPPAVIDPDVLRACIGVLRRQME